MRKAVRFFAALCIAAGICPSSDLRAQGNPADHAPAYVVSDRTAAKNRRELGIIARPLGSLDPCSRSKGPNFINFVSRGRSAGEATYLYGIDLCTRRPFVYREPTQTGVIAGFDANPPRIHWATDPTDTRNLRGDRFAFEIMAGLEGVFTSARIDYGLSVDQVADASLAPSLGVRFGRLRFSFAHAAYPMDDTWLTKVAVMPFRKSATNTRPQASRGPADSRGTIAYHEPLDDLCNATNIGIRGVDEFRLRERDDGAFPVSLEMVSYCTGDYAHYDVRTETDQSYFNEFNNTYPQFANWGEIPRGGLLSNLAIIGGYGQVDADLGGSTITSRVVYLGLGVSFGDSRWRFDIGRLFPLETLDIPGDLTPIRVTVTGWTAQIQRALQLGFPGF
jgi:hypothetical protein